MTYSAFIAEFGFSYAIPHKCAIHEVARRADAYNIIPLGGPYSEYSYVQPAVRGPHVAQLKFCAAQFSFSL